VSAPWRALALGLLLSGALTAGIAVERSGGGSSAAGHLPRGLSHEQSLLPAAALAPVSAAMGAANPAYRIDGARGALRARNPAQGLSAGFTGAGSSFAAPGIELALALRAAGYGGLRRALGEATPSASANRVLYSWPGVEESYVNGPLGVDQGFTVSRSFAGARAGGGELTLAIALGGDAHARLDGARQAITLTGAGGRTLRYGSLFASDARGRRLPSQLELDGQTILLRVDARGARYPLRIDPMLEETDMLTGESPIERPRFGYSAAISADGDTAVIGAKAGNEVWVFTRTGETWSEKPSTLEIDEEDPVGEKCEEAGECAFGRSVALSAEGNIALVGAPHDHRGDGAVWVFARSGETWTQQAVLTMGSEEVGHGRFGRSVALSADGRVALIGAGSDEGNHGAAWVFEREGTTWEQTSYKLTANAEEEQGEGHVGRSVALSADGDIALLGGPGNDGGVGAAWTFVRSGESWVQQGKALTGGEEEGAAHFGANVALSAFGNTALVAGPDETADAGKPDETADAGAVWAFARAGEAWVQQGPKLTGEEELGAGEFGSSIALSASGEVALVGAPGDDRGVGAVWLITRTGSTWTAGPEAKLTGLEGDVRQRFGTSVALSASGATALVGGPAVNERTGAAWAFKDGSAPAPTVSAVDPSKGPSEGGTPVTITGTGFLPGATVEIGGAAASSVDALSETEITAVTPPHEAGAEEVVVSDEGGRSTGGPDYTYEAPEPPPTKTTGGGSSGGSSNGSSNNSSGNGNGGNGGQGNANANAQVGVLSALVSAVPPPVLGVSGDLTPVSGKVYVKLPGATHFVLITHVTQVPFGTIVNAIHGKVKVTTQALDGHSQSMTFYAGEFKLTQSRTTGMVVAALYGGNFRVCPTKRERAHLAAVIASAHASGKHVVRKLWSEGHGSYSTKGNYASGAVLGTRWLTEDRCNGTLIFVSTDRVAVTNLVNHHHRTVHAGHSYLAKAP
jgi:hypothetical protein